MSYDPADIEARWRARWSSEGRYEADPDAAAEPTFVTVPYPYPSGGMHIGHARTYTVPDVYARYRRQQGDNVLFPIAWHVTGTPIVGAVERLRKEDPEQIDSLQTAFGVPESDLSDLETPMGFARYFIEEAESSYKSGMTDLGLSIDWRREFTTNDERYQRFIAWQYRTLKDRGLLEKGLHPVKYCTEQENPVTTHDLLEGEEVEYQDYTLVKFSGDSAIFPMATLRPETVRGVTNAYIDPDAEYAVAEVDAETWVVSVEAVEKLDLQGHTVDVTEKKPGEAFVGTTVTNPVTDEEIMLLPAAFVDPDSGSGVVMSVPAHSPDDYLALQEAQADADALSEYGIDPQAVASIEPVPILSIEQYGEIPAKDAVESAGITDPTDPALEDVTQEVYNREFHQGILDDSYGEFGGEVVEDVRDELRAHFEAADAFARLYDFPEPVRSRAGGKVVVANQETWFLRYDDPDWKAKTKRAIERIDAIPENTREQYLHTVDWLDKWPCIRNYGLGTRLPWDEDFVIEPLSDSTIYMAYYTVAHLLQDVPLEELDDTFFDTLYFGADAVEAPNDTALSLREEWDYWYPVSVRCSAPDLVANHLTFFLFHHAELFPEEDWPEGITVMGMGLLEGEKMSSSKGHVVLPDAAIEEYGADTVRFFLLNSSEPWQDFDWRADTVGTTREQLDRFWMRATETIEATAPDDKPTLTQPDRWILARLQSTIEEVTAAMDRFETRTASQAAFYRFEEDLRWYRRRVDPDAPSTRWTEEHVLEIRLQLLAPFVPFLANELGERLTGEPIEAKGWPSVDASFSDPAVLEAESIVRETYEDIQDIIEVTGTDPDVIRLYTAAEWKQSVYATVVEVGPDVGSIMGTVMQDPDLRERGDEVNRLVTTVVEDVRGQREEALVQREQLDETAIYSAAADFFESVFDARIELFAEDDPDIEDPAGKARDALPLRPAIHLG